MDVIPPSPAAPTSLLNYQIRCPTCSLPVEKYPYCSWTGRRHPPCVTKAQKDRIRELWSWANATSTTAENEKEGPEVKEITQEGLTNEVIVL